MKARQRAGGLSMALLFLGLVAVLAVCVQMHLRTPVSQPPAGKTTAAPTAPTWTDGEPVSVSGDGGIIQLPDQRSQQLTRNPSPVPVTSRLELREERAQAQLVYASGGVVQLSGKGSLDLDSAGFATRTGHFVASFRRGKQGFVIKVPTATLGVRGTTIEFALEGGTGFITLLSGQVTVTPNHGTNKSAFDWQPGQRLNIGTADLTVASDTVPPAVSVAPPTPPETLPVPAAAPNPDLGSDGVARATGDAKKPLDTLAGH